MRLLIVSQYFWPENFRINDLVAELVNRGHIVTILTGKPNYPEGYLFPEFAEDPAKFSHYAGADVVRVPMLTRGRGSLQLMLNYLAFALSASIAGPLKLRGRSFDAIFVYEPSPVTVGIPALVIKCIKKTPIAFWALDLWPQSLEAVGVVHSRAILNAIDKLVGAIYRGCDLILAQSHSFVREIGRHLNDPARVVYFPSWAEDIELSELAAPAPEVPEQVDTFGVVFTGNIGEAQDFPAVLQAAELLRGEPVRWLIVGDGRKLDWVRSEIEQRKLVEQVLLLGRFPLERMPSFLRHADALLVSLRADPTFAMTIPSKVQSYLAAGIPILAMLDGEGGDVIQCAKAGCTVPAGDAQGLANAIRQLMQMSAEERAAMGERGRLFSLREFDRATLISRLETWLSEIAKRAQVRQK
jgi:glycosyltransferase involved in cell wall biosynthesis